MPKWNCSYAYDTAIYYDVTIEAATEAEAEAKMEEALKNGRFEDCIGNLCTENAPENERVFVSGLADESTDVDDLDNLRTI